MQTLKKISKIKAGLAYDFLTIDFVTAGTW